METPVYLVPYNSYHPKEELKKMEMVCMTYSALIGLRYKQDYFHRNRTAGKRVPVSRHLPRTPKCSPSDFPTFPVRNPALTRGGASKPP